MAVATVFASGGFAAINGSAIANATTMATVALPEMRRLGYAPGLAMGVIAAGGTLGPMIPPSVLFVLYAILVDEDISRLFIAGILPGLLAMALYCVAICWGIATATYADRHITVDMLYAAVNARWRYAIDVAAHTLGLLFFAAFGFMINFKVYDILKAGERSVDLNLPIWAGYLFAAAGILITFVLAGVRWWQVVWMRRP